MHKITLLFLSLVLSCLFVSFYIFPQAGQTDSNLNPSGAEDAYSYSITPEPYTTPTPECIRGGFGSDENGCCPGDVPNSCGRCDNQGADSCNLCPGQSGYNPNRPSSECCPGITKDCKGICGGSETEDSCGICGGSGKDPCGLCPNESGYNPNRPASECNPPPSQTPPPPSPTPPPPSPTPPICEVESKYTIVKALYTDKTKRFNGMPIHLPISGGRTSCIDNIIASCGASVVQRGGDNDHADYCALGKFLGGEAEKNKNPLFASAGSALYHQLNSRFFNGKLLPSDLPEGTCHGDAGDKCWTPVAIGALDENCRPVDINTALSSIPEGCNIKVAELRAADSPISLIWDESVRIEDVKSIASFPINLGSNGKWYAWKGSKYTPLLVYDPMHTGEITSADKLFGQWTFGGNKSASLGNGSNAKAWENGYQALATLDSNGNGKVDSRELDSLALWFDNNQNAISEKGEVLTLKELGVSALFFTETTTEVNGNVVAQIGFERVNKDGSTSTGKSVDWFAKSYESKAEATAAEITGQKILPLLDNAKETNKQETIAANNNSLSPFFGAWRWEAVEQFKDQFQVSSNDNASIETARPQGLLLFNLRDGKLNGRSITEQIVETKGLATNSGISRLMLSSAINVLSIGKTKLGEPLVKFEIISTDDRKTLSEAYINKQGELVGKSTTPLYGKQSVSEITSDDISFEYSWTAKKQG